MAILVCTHKYTKYALSETIFKKCKAKNIIKTYTQSTVYEPVISVNSKRLFCPL
jgi:hypothetical protein